MEGNKFMHNFRLENPNEKGNLADLGIYLSAILKYIWKEHTDDVDCIKIGSSEAIMKT
jgi:hypothetical protein